MMTRFFWMLLIVVAAIGMPGISVSGADGLRIQGRVRENPTLYFAGIRGSEQLSGAVGGFLHACGWFDVVKQENADYTVSGELNGSTATLQLQMGGVPMHAWRIPAGDPRRTAKVLVDAMLEKLFKVKDLCFSRIAFCADIGGGKKEIYACDIDGGDLQQITRFNSLCVEPCWVPDGRSIVYTRYAQSRTEIVETRFFPTLQSRILTSFPGLNTGASVSPDKSRVATILSPDHLVDLYVRPLSGGTPFRLTRGRAVEASPCWSPDSSSICFVSDQSGRPRIYSVPVGGGTIKQLPSVGREAVTPDWSGDDQIVYATTVGGSYTLAVLNLKTGENIRATMVPGTWESPAWGPDNRQVVCKRSDGPRASLFIVDTWTGKARQLLATKNALSMPCWSKGVR